MASLHFFPWKSFFFPFRRDSCQKSFFPGGTNERIEEDIVCSKLPAAYMNHATTTQVTLHKSIYDWEMVKVSTCTQEKIHPSAYLFTLWEERAWLMCVCLEDVQTLIVPSHNEAQFFTLCYTWNIYHQITTSRFFFFHCRVKRMANEVLVVQFGKGTPWKSFKHNRRKM